MAGVKNDRVQNEQDLGQPTMFRRNRTIMAFRSWRLVWQYPSSWSMKVLHLVAQGVRLA